MENQVLAAVKPSTRANEWAADYWQLHQEIPEAVQAALALDDHEISSALPQYAMLSMSHETQYSRLFGLSFQIRTAVKRLKSIIKTDARNVIKEINMSERSPLRVGIGGPVGSGKTALTLNLCLALREKYNMAVVTNDIYQRRFELLTRHEAMSPDRIVECRNRRLSSYCNS